MDHLDIQQAHFFGVSLGARIALRFAIDHPDAVLSLTLSAPIIANESAGNAALNAGFNMETMAPERKANLQDLHGEDWPKVMANYVIIRNTVAVQDYYNLRELCKRVLTPTLVVHSGDEEDTVHPLSHARELSTSMPNAKLIVDSRLNLGNSEENQFLRDAMRDHIASVGSDIKR
jgi:pimeloyl-ACP methyl ester carboxylesterase